MAAVTTCVLAQPALAQETITLDEAIGRAMQRSARIEELGARQAGAEAAMSGRTAARMPSVALVGGYTRTNHVDEFGIAAPGQPLRLIYPDVPDNPHARLDLRWPIYTGGRTGALERAAQAERNASVEDLQAARADLRLEVTRAFWALVTARETERVLSRAVQRMDAQVSDLRTRLDQGVIPPNDLTSAEAQRSRQRVLAIEARNTRLVTEADLRRLVGGSGPVAPAETGTAADLPVHEKGMTVEKGMTLSGSERRAFEERLIAARARQAATAATTRPQVAAVAGYDYARPNPRIFPRAARWKDSWDVGFNISWTVWDGGRRRAEQAEAAAATGIVRARITEFERQRAFELEQRRLEVESSRAAIAAAEEGVRSALETQRVVAERYRAGVATGTDVLDAEVALLQAELERTRALANERLASARLERAAAR